MIIQTNNMVSLSESQEIRGLQYLFCPVDDEFLLYNSQIL